VIGVISCKDAKTQSRKGRNLNMTRIGDHRFRILRGDAIRKISWGRDRGINVPTIILFIVRAAILTSRRSQRKIPHVTTFETRFRIYRRDVIRGIL